MATGALTFEPWEEERYPCFDLALSIAKRGGTWPAALCGADEAAVEGFLARRIGFLEIGPVIQEALAEHKNVEEPSLEDAISAANWARKQVSALAGG